MRYLAEILTRLGQHERASAALDEARSILVACVDPATLADTARAAPRQARDRTTRVVESLTQRELTVLTLLAGDGSEADIGRELFVSHSTVHSHVRSIYGKLGATSRAEAVELARAAGFLPTPSMPGRPKRK